MANLSVIDHAAGKCGLLARQCDTCVFRPGNPMALRAGRVRDLVDRARRGESYVVCHETLPSVHPAGGPPAVCRGFFDRYSTNGLRMMGRLFGFVEVPPLSPNAWLHDALSRTVPALTLRRPWAALLLRAGKDVENRGWATSCRGPLLIHAGKTWDDGALPFAATISTGDDGTTAADRVHPGPEDHPAGIVGAVRLVDVVSGHPSPWAVRGQYQWVRADPVTFAAPVACPGRQGLWCPDAGIRAQLREMVR